MRNVHLILLPVACDPHPATGTTDPMTFHPNSRCRSTRDPRAGDPHILGSGPAPITARPNIPRTWRDGLRLDANRRRSLSYQDLSRGWTRLICFFGVMILPVLPRYSNFGWRVRKGTKNLAGKSPPPDSDPFSDGEFEKIAPACQANSPHAQVAASSSRNALNFSSACTIKRRPSSRCALTIQIVRP